MGRGSWFVIAGLLLAGISCAHRRPGADAQPADAPVHVNVINHYTLPVDVFAVGSGVTYRMGTVHPGIASTFVLRQSMVGNGPVEFVAQPAGTEPPVRSGQLLLAPGDVVEFEITTPLFHSTATVTH